MKKKNNIPFEDEPGYDSRIVFFTAVAILGVILGILFFNISFVETMGFNPSDDGVILAQSYRIVNGEIPHKDFIAIRPVFSGILHSIHFFSGLPLEISARWFVVVQYFIYSILWVYLLFRIFKIYTHTRFRFLVYSVCAGIYAFVLNMNYYNLFPWTTIDAVFFSVIGFVFYLKAYDEDILYRNSFFTIAGLIFICMAALCRQSFALLSLILHLTTFISILKRKNYLTAFFTLIIGSVPIWAYLIFVYQNDAAKLFLQQITGRTEIVQTGIIQFIKSFIKAKLLILNMATLLLFAYLYFKSRAWQIKNKKFILSDRQKMFTAAIIAFYNAAALFFSFYFFLKGESDIRTTPFELFWILFVVSIITWFTNDLAKKQKAFIIAGLLLAWCSSISLGDNTPVFTTGIMASQIVILSAFTYFNSIFSRPAIPGTFKFLSPILAIVILILFIISSIYGQQKMNYRDRQSSELTSCLCSISDDFGTVQTNKTTYEYYADFINIYNHFPGMKNNFVMAPNNAIIYPVMNSKNPFPLDWLQPAEYVGSENYLYSKIEDIISKKNIYLILDIYNSKEMAFHLVPLKYNQYGYLKRFKNRFVEIPVNSKFFRVFKSL